MDSKSSIVELDDDSPTISQDQLQFQDIPHTGSHQVKVDVTRGRGQQDKVQTHTFTNFPPADESDEEDRQDLLEGQKKQPSFWTFEYYQSFFDVDTTQVLQRILRSMIPNPRSNYLQTHIRPKPDLYGPFWVCVTLVFTTAIAGNISNYMWLHDYEKEYEWKYDFHKVTFSTTAIFAYWWLVPTALYGVLWWRGNQASFLFTELLCVYGYSLAIYIPISILWMIQVSWLQWLLVMVGMALSGSVLVLTILPGFKNDKKQVIIGVLALIVALHGLLATGFMLYFFHVPSIDTLPSSTTAALNSTSYSMPVTKFIATSQSSLSPTALTKSSENNRI